MFAATCLAFLNCSVRSWGRFSVIGAIWCGTASTFFMTGTVASIVTADAYNMEIVGAELCPGDYNASQIMGPGLEWAIAAAALLGFFVLVHIALGYSKTVRSSNRVFQVWQTTRMLRRSTHSLL